MTTNHTYFSDLAKEVQPPDKGILSRTLYNDDRLKAVAFGFAQGELAPAAIRVARGVRWVTGVPWVGGVRDRQLAEQKPRSRRADFSRVFARFAQCRCHPIAPSPCRVSPHKDCRPAQFLRWARQFTHNTNSAST
jgi:hypothetical protein